MDHRLEVSWVEVMEYLGGHGAMKWTLDACIQKIQIIGACQVKTIPQINLLKVVYPIVFVSNIFPNSRLIQKRIHISELSLAGVLGVL